MQRRVESCLCGVCLITSAVVFSNMGDECQWLAYRSVMSQHRKLFESNSKLPTVAISPDDQQEESDCLTLAAVMHRRSSTVLVYLCHAYCVWLVQWVLCNASCIVIVLLSICLLYSSLLCLMCCLLFLCSWFCVNPFLSPRAFLFHHRNCH